MYMVLYILSIQDLFLVTSAPLLTSYFFFLFVSSHLLHRWGWWLSLHALILYPSVCRTTVIVLCMSSLVSVILIVGLEVVSHLNAFLSVGTLSVSSGSRVLGFVATWATSFILSSADATATAVGSALCSSARVLQSIRVSSLCPHCSLLFILFCTLTFQLQ